MPTRLVVSGLTKTFVMHLQGGVRLPVVGGVDFSVDAGECVVLGGPSGAGKSSILKMVYGNYAADGGQVVVRTSERLVDVVSADPRTIVRLRQTTIGYVSQFLRVVPRVSALDVVAEPLLSRIGPQDRPDHAAPTGGSIERTRESVGPSRDSVGQGRSADGPSAAARIAAARERAGALLARLNVPERLWSLPPATFSGGEQQRVNIARGFITDHPILLLDEPTASLDAANRAVVISLIAEKKNQGVAMLGIFHDEEVRTAVADRIIDVTRFRAAA